MPLSLKLELDGFVEVDRILGDWVRQISDWRPAFHDIVNDWSSTMKEAFDRGGAVDGLKPWPDLQPATIAAKRRKGYPFPAKPLIATGRLRRGATHPQVRMTATTLHLRVNVPYGVYHQSRLPRKPAPNRPGDLIPRRPFITIGERGSTKQVDRWIAILEAHAAPPE